MVTTPPSASNEDLAAVVPATIGEALHIVHEVLGEAPLCFGHGTDNAWDEALALVLSATGRPLDSDESVLPLPISESSWSTARQWLTARVKDRIPLPYLTGEAWFAGLPFHCDQRALVPRSPLAQVIRDDYSPWWSGAAPERLLDLCCGGGCIGIAAAVYHPELTVVMADIDRDALQLADKNIAMHKVSDRVAVTRSDLFTSLGGERFDIILSNPPYVDASDLTQMPREYQSEPVLGLQAGDDGLEIVLRILAEAAEHLSPGGLLFLELGNSWEALDRHFRDYPLTWLEFSDGGHGVIVLRQEELLLLPALP